ncbi:MAG: hypothetical protein H0U74_01560 [Bradymonadaceae bacterium]|nr:hypothetical protein [Lujinxingiaceae bacterium]
MACEFDSDCGNGNLCVEFTCTNTCATDLDCQSVQGCQAFLRKGESDPVHVCMPEDVYNNDPGQCADAAQCQALMADPAAICGINRRCVVPIPEDDRPVHAIYIRDLSSSTDDVLGTMLAAVFVRDTEGNVVGFADTLAFVPADQSEQPGHLDGSPPKLDESGQCVAGEEPVLSALGGLGGHYVIGFVDNRGAGLQLEQGWKVVVIAWGPNCGEERDPPNEYEVSLCVSASDEVLDFDAHCHALNGRSSGYSEFLVTLN